MNKIFKSAYVVLAGVLALMAASCTDDYTYDAPTPETGQQVYFSSETQTQWEVSDTETSFNIPIYRANTSGATTVNLTFTASTGNIYTVPSSVTFADGDSVAQITVTYDNSKLVAGTYTGGTIAIADSALTTLYGASTYTFTAGVTAWEDMTSDDGTTTKGYFQDDLVSCVYGLDTPDAWTVTIQKNVKTEGLYRVVQPYASGYFKNYFAATSDENGNDLIIDATDPDYVYFTTFDAGLTLNSSDGALSFVSYVKYLMDNKGYTLAQIKQGLPQLFGTLKDGVISFSEPNSLLVALNGKVAGETNLNGTTKIALPGYTIKDYSATATYNGRFIDTDENYYANVTITLGDDVAKAKYYLASSSEDASALADSIADGNTFDGVVEITASGSEQISYTKSGTYTLIIVTYDSDGNVQGTYAYELSLTGNDAVKEVFEDVALGTLTIGTKSIGSAFFKEDPGTVFKNFSVESVLSQSTSDATHFKLTPFINEGYPLDFYVGSDNVISVPLQDMGTRDNDGAMFQVVGTVDDMGEDYKAKLVAAGLASNYDASSNLYTFDVFYRVTKGYYGAEVETFLVTEDGSAKIAQAMKKARKAVKPSMIAKQTSQLKLEFLKFKRTKLH